MLSLFSDDENAVIEELRRKGGFARDEDVLRNALFRFALFMDVEVPAGVFDLAYRNEMRSMLTRDRPGEPGLPFD